MHYFKVIGNCKNSLKKNVNQNRAFYQFSSTRMTTPWLIDASQSFSNQKAMLALILPNWQPFGSHKWCNICVKSKNATHYFFQAEIKFCFNVQNPEIHKIPKYKIPNWQNPKWTKSWTGHNPEWTKFWIEQNPERKKSRIEQNPE